MTQIHEGMPIKDAMKELGLRLRRTRIDQNLTLGAVAERCGISATTVRHLEEGGGSRLEMLFRVLDGLEKLSELDQVLSEPDPAA